MRLVSQHRGTADQALMSPRAPKQCGRFGCDVLVTGQPYCDDHTREASRLKAPSPSSRAANNPRERARRKAAVQHHVTLYGFTCPGWERAAHFSTDLTAAHSTAVALGGTDSPLTVLCRPCNSRQARQGTVVSHT